MTKPLPDTDEFDNQDCDTCKHQRLGFSEHPCNTCSREYPTDPARDNNWVPKAPAIPLEDTDEFTDKDCYACKHQHTPLGGLPCEGCQRQYCNPNNELEDHWEPKEE